MKKEKILRNILARVEEQVATTSSMVAYEDRLLDIIVTLAVANADARELIDLAPITREKRNQARKFLDTHTDL